MYCENWSLSFVVLHYISVQVAVVSIICYEVTKRAVKKRSLEWASSFGSFSNFFSLANNEFFGLFGGGGEEEVGLQVVVTLEFVRVITNFSLIAPRAVYGKMLAYTKALYGPKDIVRRVKEYGEFCNKLSL